jgi:serine/threonine protein kinase/tetratricopeptide (TPR) repeat protein
MPETPDPIESIFAAAVALGTPAERVAYLDQACAGDLALRGRVEALLRADERSEHLLDKPVLGRPEQTGGYAAGEQSGTVIAGRYKLLEEIGAGGMGTVWVAEQIEPVKRKVALKLIKPGMDSKSVLARFEAERQALALMDHPNIAKVLDGGLTEAGRPYFVMEYVKGVPITEYCDATRLRVADRLQLFVQVCQAVQHAHQKGIIHRDLKPSNVLVAPYDDRPVPKVIDFGLAKAMNQSLTDRTLHTAHEAVLGTPLYMSPEQAQLNNLDVDTRSDIYSLGVLLYELLTGTTPLEKQRFQEAAWDEIRRVIREEEPPRPSARLSSTATLPSLAACRQTEPALLTRLVRGELDWIVMKALEKDRTRRYETANGLARDIQRYLADEMVEARPASTGYRLRKFARKNRAALTTAAAIALLLVAGVAISAWQAVRAARAEAEARQAERQALEARQAEADRAEGERQAKQDALDRKHDAEQAADAERRAKESAQKRLAQIEKGSEILGSIFKDLDPREEERQGKPLRTLLGERLQDAGKQLEAEAVGDPVTVARLQNTMAASLSALGYPKPAVDLLTKARATFMSHLGPNDLEALSSANNLAHAYEATGRADLAAPLLEQTVAACKTTPGLNHSFTLMTMNNLAHVYQNMGKLDQALQLYEQTAAGSKTALGPDNPQTLVILDNLANAYRTTGKYDQAIALYEQNLARFKASLGPNHFDTLICMNELTETYQYANRWEPALPLGERALAAWKAKLGPDNTHTLTAMFNLATVYRDVGRLDQAIALYEQALAARRTKYGPEDRNTLIVMNGLAVAYWLADKPDLAVPLAENALNIRRAKLGPDAADTLVSMNTLAGAYLGAGKIDQALQLYEQTLTGQRAKFGPEHHFTLKTMGNLAMAYGRARRHDRAIPLLEQALPILTAKLGKDGALTLRVMYELAVNYHHAGKLDLALPLYEQSVALHRARFGIENDMTLHSMDGLAMIYRDTGQHNRAVPLFEQVLAARKKVLGVDHVKTLSSMNNLASAYWSIERSDLAIPLLEETLKLQQARLGPDHSDTLATMVNLGANYARIGKHDRAVALSQQALDLYKARLGPDHPDTLRCMNNLAGAYWRGGKLDRSVPLFEDTLGRQTRKLGRDHPETILTIANLGINYRDAGRIQEAIPLLEEALDRANKLKPFPAVLTDLPAMMIETYDRAGLTAKSEPLRRQLLAQLRTRIERMSNLAQVDAEMVPLADALAQLGRNLLQQQKWTDGEPILRECLAIREKKLADDWTTFNTKSMLGGALLGQKKYAEAEPLLLAGYEGMKARDAKIPSQGRPRVAAALERLVQLYEATGKKDDAARWRKELDARKSASASSKAKEQP